MQALQKLMDKGWILRVKKDEPGVSRSDMPYLAQITDPVQRMDVDTAHAHVGKTVEDAITALDRYVARLGKEPST